MSGAEFVVREGGVYYAAVEDVPGAGERVCSRLEVVARVRDAESGSWGKLLVWQDADGTEHREVLPESALLRGGFEAVSMLITGGLQVQNAKLLLRYLQAAAPEARSRLICRTGWHEEGGALGYVLPDRVVGLPEGAAVFSSGAVAAEYAQRGTLEEWRSHVAALCVGNSRAVFGVSLAFASMLLWHAGEESGGVHLFGPSSSGKTTVAKVAASVFGGPTYLQRWRATDNGLEGVAECHTDALLVLDELAQCDPRRVGDIAYMLANGEGKLRAGRTGEARARKRWRLLFLSDGETTLAQHIASGGGSIRAGQEVRMVDLPADAGAGLGAFEDLHGDPSPAEFARRLARGAQAQYGTACREFARRCIERATDLPETTIALRTRAANEMLSAAGGDPPGGQVSRVAGRFALVAAAGELATAFGVTGWREGEAADAARKCFADWLDSRESAVDSEPQAILEAVREFLARHAESRLTDLAARAEDDEEGRRPPRPTYNRAGWLVRVGDGREEYWLEPGVFRRDVCRDFEPTHVCRVLAKQGCLLHNEEAGKTRYTLQRHTPQGKKRLYVLTSAIWES